MTEIITTVWASGDPRFARFDPEVGESWVGNPVKFGKTTGTITEARLVEDGSAIEVTIEVPDKAAEVFRHPRPLSFTLWDLDDWIEEEW